MRESKFHYFIINISDLPSSPKNSKYIYGCSDVDNHFKTSEVWLPMHEQVEGFSGDDDTIFNPMVSQLCTRIAHYMY